MKLVLLLIRNNKLILRLLWLLTFVSLIGTYFFYQNVKTDLKFFLGNQHYLVKEMELAESKMKIVDYTLVQVESDKGAASQILESLKLEIEKNNLSDFKTLKVDFKDEIQFFKDSKAIYFTTNDWKKLAEKIYPKPLENKDTIEDSQTIKIRNTLINLINYKRLKEFAIFSMLPNGVMISKDNDQGMLIILHSKPMTNLDSAIDVVEKLEAISEKVKRSYGERINKIRFNGYAHSLVSEYKALWGDLLGSGTLVVVFTIIIIYYLFRSLWALVFIYVPLFLGIGLSYTFGGIFLSNINSNAAFLTSIVAGGSINTGIMILARFIHLEDKGNLSERVFLALEESLYPSLIAMATTAFAFLALILIPLQSFKDFAILGLMGTVFCWAIYFCLLPILAQSLLDIKKITINFSPVRLSETITKKITLSVFGLATIVFAILYFNGDLQPKMFIEQDMRKIKNQNYESENFNSFFSHFKSLNFNPRLVPVGTLMFDSRLEAEKMKSALSSDPIIYQIIPDLRVYSISDILPNDYQEKIGYIERIQNKKNLAEIRKHPYISATEEEMIDSINIKYDWQKLESNIPDFFRQIFSNKHEKLGSVLYLNFDLNRLEQDLFLLIKYQQRIERIAHSLGLKGSGVITGVMPILSEVGKVFVENVFQIYTTLLILISVIVFFSVKELQKKAFYLVTFVGTQVLYILCLYFFKEKINILSFFAVLLTLGVGVDYLINLNLKNKIQADLSLYIIACSLTTILSYLSLNWGTNHLAIQSFARLALWGEICALASSFLIGPFLINKYKS